MHWSIRAFEAGDADAVHRVVAAAFGREAEATLVDQLRGADAWLADLALVATDAVGLIRGFAALTQITVDGRPALALAPVAVSPDWQRRGAGTALVHEGIRRAVVRGERLILVLGSPAYYGRFGFVPAIALGITGPYGGAGDAFQALVLAGSAPAPTGRAVYSRSVRRPVAHPGPGPIHQLSIAMHLGASPGSGPSPGHSDPRGPRPICAGVHHGDEGFRPPGANRHRKRHHGDVIRCLTPVTPCISCDVTLVLFASRSPGFTAPAPTPRRQPPPPSP